VIPRSIFGSFRQKDWIFQYFSLDNWFIGIAVADLHYIGQVKITTKLS